MSDLAGITGETGVAADSEALEAAKQAFLTAANICREQIDEMRSALAFLAEVWQGKGFQAAHDVIEQGNQCGDYLKDRLDECVRKVEFISGNLDSTETSTANTFVAIGDSPLLKFLRGA